MFAYCVLSSAPALFKSSVLAETEQGTLYIHGAFNKTDTIHRD